jgi:hypothetical protein
MPLWTILDTTPEGRGTDWYPKLNYPKYSDSLHRRIAGGHRRLRGRRSKMNA